MGAHLRLLTANLLNGGADPDRFADLLPREQLDVVCLQELSHDQADAVAEVLPYGELMPSDDFVGMGIALRRPAVLEVIPMVYRRAHVATLSPEHWPELPKPVEVIDVHFAAPHSPPVWAQPARRASQFDDLLRYVQASSERTRVVVGDFNASPVWPLYRRMAALLDDLVSAHARRCGKRPRPTWPVWAGPALLRIDHCFGRGVDVETCRMLDIPGSDHYGIRLDLSIA